MKTHSYHRMKREIFRVLLINIIFVILLAWPARKSDADPLEAFRTQEVTYHNNTLKLGALLVLPEGTAPFPAAVIVHGSGRSDRNNEWSRSITEMFVSRGVAVLLTDKRGSGQSGGNWQTAGLEDFAADAIAGIELLRTRNDIDSSRIGLIGLSQGGWIAPLAAAKSNHVAFVVDFSGASVSFAEQLFLEMKNTAQQQGLSEESILEVLELNRKAGIFLVTNDWESFAAARKSALNRPWKKIAEGFPSTRDAPIWSFYRSSWNFDPMPYWILIEAPVLICYGELDEQDNVPVQESIRRLEFAFKSIQKKNYSIISAPGVGHALWGKDFKLAPEINSGVEVWLKRYIARN